MLLNVFENTINDTFINTSDFWAEVEELNLFENSLINESSDTFDMLEADIHNDVIVFKEDFDQINEIFFEKNTKIIESVDSYNNKVNFLDKEFDFSTNKHNDSFDNLFFSKNFDNYELDYFNFDSFESDQKNYLKLFKDNFLTYEKIKNEAQSIQTIDKKNSMFINNIVDSDVCNEETYSEELLDSIEDDLCIHTAVNSKTENSQITDLSMPSALKNEVNFYSHNSDYNSNETSVFNKNFLPFFFLIKKLKNAFFLKSIFNFFFFFLPVSFFNYIYIAFGLEIKKILFKNRMLLNRNLKYFETQVDLVDILYNYDYEIKTRNKNNNFCFFLFLSNFFSEKIKENVSISFTSTAEIENDFKYFFYKNLNGMGFFFKNQMISFNYSDFFDIFFLCLKLKDLSSFADFLKELFEKIQIKFHKLFLKKFELFLFSFFNKFKKKFKIKGFLLDVRGKVSVVGNSKKRHIIVKKGYLSKSKKTLKFFFCKNQINTNTGVLGATYILSY